MGNQRIEDTNKSEFAGMYDIEYTIKGDMQEVQTESFFGEENEDIIVNIKGKRQIYEFKNSAENQSGKGNQSRVFYGNGKSDNQRYVIKLYKPDDVDEAALVSVLKQLEHLKHANITNIVEYGQCEVLGNNHYYVVMDVYEPLDRELYRWKNKDTSQYRERIYSLVYDMNEALRFIHANHVIHGDIKPDNIMFNQRTKKCVLIDFGASVKKINASQTSVKAHAKSQKYMAAESVTTGDINTYTDYYALGLSLAELIAGIFPNREEMEKNNIGEVKEIYSFVVPKDLPDYYENLLRGLLFQKLTSQKKLIRKNRWNVDKVSAWLNAIRENQLEDAARLNQIQVEDIEEVKEKERTNNIVDVKKRPFGETLILEMGETKRDCEISSLNEMADKFLSPELWDDAVDILLNDDPNQSPFEDIKRKQVLIPIREGISAVQAAHDSVETGISVNAVFFKFLFKYVSDPKIFRWKDLPNVNSLEDFARILGIELGVIEQNNGYFGEWWKWIGEETASISTTLAEIFKNKVLSFYLDKSELGNSKIKQQCKKVEGIFQQLKTQYSSEELTEMFLLQRMILDKTSYKLSTGLEYDSYDAFLTDVEAKAYDENRVHEMEEIINGVQGENGFYPDFLAWKKMSGK